MPKYLLIRELEKEVEVGTKAEAEWMVNELPDSEFTRVDSFIERQPS